MARAPLTPSQLENVWYPRLAQPSMFLKKRPLGVSVWFPIEPILLVSVWFPIEPIQVLDVSFWFPFQPILQVLDVSFWFPFKPSRCFSFLLVSFWCFSSVSLSPIRLPGSTGSDCRPFSPDFCCAEPLPPRREKRDSEPRFGGGDLIYGNE